MVVNIFLGLSLFIVSYTVLLNAFQTLNMTLAAFVTPAFNKRYLFRKGIRISRGLSKPMSILIPAYNEGMLIIDSIKSLLSIDFEDYEIIVANDGSNDDTLEILITSFDMVKVDVEPTDLCDSKQIKAVYYSRIEPKLVVVDKENGGKADAQNAAARLARNAYFCVVDADTLLDYESLNNMAQRLTGDPDLVAIGGVIRATNGCRIEDGIIKDVGIPRRFIERVQILEYFRAFLFGRVGLSAMNSLTIISGAFGVFRWDAFAILRGWNREAIGEDFDAVLRLHRVIYEKKLSWKIKFEPIPISWTQVPMTWKSLGDQRERWQRGLMQTLGENPGVFMNPKYRAIGLIGYPSLVVEMISSIVDFLCYPVSILGLVLGILNTTYLFYFMAIVLVWGLSISLFTIIIHEYIKYRYGKPGDLWKMITTVFLENFGYRQIHSYWRLLGTMKFIFIKSSRTSGMKGWTAIQRTGFNG